MNESRFEHLRKRGRSRLPRPVLYVGIAVVFLAFFSVKLFQRFTGDGTSAADGSEVAEVAESDPQPLVQESWGVPALDGSGRRIQPPKKIGGEPPAIPDSLRQSAVLEDPRVFIRVDEEGLVTEVKLVISSGHEEVDRLVLGALAEYTFRPAMSKGKPVVFTMVVPVPLAEDSGTVPPA